MNLIRSNDKSLSFKVAGDYSSSYLEFAVKIDTDIDSNILIKKTTNDGISVAYSNGISTITIVIDEADTSTLDAGNYVYDITEIDITTRTTISGPAILSIIGDVNNPDSTVTINPAIKVYRALLNQTGTANPLVRVQENTLGNVTITRQSQGVYYIVCESTFTETKTYPRIDNILPSEEGYINTATIERTNGDRVTINTSVGDFSQATSYLSDTLLNFTAVEILVYP